MLSEAKPTMCMDFTLKLTQIQHRICNVVPACIVTLGGKSCEFSTYTELNNFEIL